MLSRTGFWAFIVGLILSLIAGLVSAYNTPILIVLVILGLIIGFLNITAKETMLFLVATIALIVAGGAFSPLGVLGRILGQILGYVAALMAPAAVVAAIKALWAIGKPSGAGQ